MSTFFYDGQIRRYITQVIRLMSNFVVKNSDGTLTQVPVTYGDIDRQVAAIISGNSENTAPAAPQIAVYISSLSLDRNRLSDSSFESKLHIRERAITTGAYTEQQGQNYTIERLMPTPYMLSFKVDMWTASAEQKLQLLEQILMLFNPSLEIQTTDNYVDWTSLSVVDLEDITFSSRTIPSGTETPIDVASLTLNTPIWISPPAKVKRLGVITNVIANITASISDAEAGYISGLGVDTNNNGRTVSGNVMTTNSVSISNYGLMVSGLTVKLLNTTPGQPASWPGLIDQLPGTYSPGLVKIFLKQPSGAEVLGYGATNSLDDSILSISSWDVDTFPANTLLPGPSRNNAAWGSFDYIIDPTKTVPSTLAGFTAGTRMLLTDNIGSGIRETLVTNAVINQIDTEVLFDSVYSYKFFVNGVETVSVPVNIGGNFVIRVGVPIAINSTVRFELNLNSSGAVAWKNSDATDFIADFNDIVEWSGTEWSIVFSAKAATNDIVYQTNLFSLKQLTWNGQEWTDSFEGHYRNGEWRVQL
jgi:hypothetical protein